MKPTPSPRRVAFVASYAPSLVLFRGELIREIVARGHKMLCAAPDFDGKTAAALQAWGAEIRTIPLARTGLNPLSDIATSRALTRLFREWRPGVVMGYTPKPAIYASLAAQKAGVAQIVPMLTGLGYAFLEGGGIKGRLVRNISSRLYARAFKVSNGVIFHNADDARMLIGRGLVPSALPVTVVRGSGVDLNHFKAEPQPPADKGLTFLMIARLLRYKGVAEYCKAARDLKSQGLEARFQLVGPPESGPSGFPLTDLESYADAVDWLGPRDDVRGALAGAHVYVLPSYGEGMPRTVLEALATGRPVITTDTRGCRETVREGVNGTLVPIRDAAALARAMRKFIEHPERLETMGKASRQLAEAEFGVVRVNAAMLKALGLDGTAVLPEDGAR